MVIGFSLEKIQCRSWSTEGISHCLQRGRVSWYSHSDLAMTVYGTLSHSPPAVVQAYSWDWEGIRESLTACRHPSTALLLIAVVSQPLVDRMLWWCFFPSLHHLPRGPDMGFLIEFPQNSYRPRVSSSLSPLPHF